LLVSVYIRLHGRLRSLRLLLLLLLLLLVVVVLLYDDAVFISDRRVSRRS